MGSDVARLGEPEGHHSQLEGHVIAPRKPEDQERSPLASQLCSLENFLDSEDTIIEEILKSQLRKKEPHVK